MKHSYDYVFITHLPAFYKVNLYNALAKLCSIYVIFISDSSTIRAQDFTQNACNFDYKILNHQPFEKRNQFISLWHLYRAIRKLSYRKVVLGGWDLLEFWMLAIFSPKAKNTLALESSIYESANTGLRAWIKQRFLSRVEVVFSSGSPHEKLLQALDYQGSVRITKGVGIFNYPTTQSSRLPVFEGKFLYVGRLAPEKNLRMLIKAFHVFPQFSLTIIGHGPDKSKLEKLAPSNVNIVGHVPNEALAGWYQSHDVFVLPSMREPWGLVVEEALFHGLPVIVSNRVGCGQDLIENQQAGILFDADQKDAMVKAIQQIQENYAYFVKQIAQIDFLKRDQYQIQQYRDVIG